MDRINVRANILKENQHAAIQNRLLFDREQTVVVNLMSAPGAGKTTLLEATLRKLRDYCRVAVMKGIFKLKSTPKESARWVFTRIQITTEQFATSTRA